MDALPESLRAPASHVAPDADELLAFLRWLRPDGPWVLDTCKTPGRRSAVFGPGEEAALRAWADGLGERDTYTLVGLPEEGVAGQPTKEQMRGAEVLWVDLDPRAGEEVTKERERMLALLTTARPTTLPPPSLIVDSGRGLWAFWRLAAPLHDAGLVERLKGMRSGAVEHLKSFLSRSVDRARMAAPVACACSRRTRRSSWRR